MMTSGVVCALEGHQRQELLQLQCGKKMTSEKFGLCIPLFAAKEVCCCHGKHVFLGSPEGGSLPRVFVFPHNHDVASLGVLQQKAEDCKMVEI